MCLPDGGQGKNRISPTIRRCVGRIRIRPYIPILIFLTSLMRLVGKNLPAVNDKMQGMSTLEKTCRVIMRLWFALAFLWVALFMAIIVFSSGKFDSSWLSVTFGVPIVGYICAKFLCWIIMGFKDDDS